MSPFAMSGIAVFIIMGFTLYLSRKRLTQRGRLILAGLMFMLAGVTVWEMERHRATYESVWHPNAPQWKTIPLVVHWDPVVFEPYKETFYTALKTWNERIGCLIFAPAADRWSASVVIRSYDGTQCGVETVGAKQVDENADAPASAWFCNGYVDIQIKRLDDVQLAFRIALHELGHAIGLDHDDRGAMSVAAAKPQPGDAPEYLLPSAKDVAAIKQRYCH